MSELSPRSRELFARARASGAPTSAERARLLERVERAVAPSVAPPAAPTSALGPTIAVVGLVVLAVALSVIGPSESERPPTATAPSPPSVVSTPSVPDLAPIAVVAETPTAAPPPTRAQTHAARRASRDEATDDLTIELGLLRRAQAARRAHRYAAALATLDEHRRRFPNGTLASERDVARALTLCESGHLDEGRVLGARFSGTAWSGSITQACTPVDDSETP